jgi:chemotaxis protein methyltransferase CheR
MNLDAAQEMLQARLGLCFEGHAEVQLRRALEQRIAAFGLDDVSAYLAHLAADEGELHALAGLLTIKETYFNREPQHLRLLIDHLVPALLRNRAPGEPVRIFSAGCATGEEPYSISIALRDRWGESALRRFRIAAGDLDPEAIAWARAGRYRPWSFRAMDPVLIERWFTPAADGTRELAESFRQWVAFRHLNLLADPYPSELRGQDVIFYRNISIYFDAATRATVLRQLRDLLRPGGYLIVGTAETLANDVGLLALCEHGGVWYFANRDGDVPPTLDLHGMTDERQQVTGARRNSPFTFHPGLESGSEPGLERETGTTAIDNRPPPSTPARVAVPGPNHDALYRQAMELARAERFTAARAVLAPVCAAPEALPLHLLLEAQLALELVDLQGAAVAARRILEADAWSVEARVLLGRIARLQGALGEAVEHLRRAIYARPDHWPAHFELAECRAAAGRREAARREYRIALRLLGEAGPAAAQAIPLPAVLPVADLRYLCQARLARLDDPV